MKIKCPFCDWEESRGDTIETHLWFEMYNGKSHSPEKIVNYLYTLYSKIHEKIEFWGARHPMVVKEFESLLENEK